MLLEHEVIMPYTYKGKTVYKKEGGKLKKVGTTKGSVKKYLAALHANVKESYKGKFEKLFEKQLNILNR